MYEIPRSRLIKITIRPDKAVAILNQLAVGGRTKVSIIEDALARAVARARAQTSHPE